MFDMRSFCIKCGKVKRTMPFGEANPIWDRQPCPHCGDGSCGEFIVAKKKRVGRWPWQTAWVGKEGNIVDAKEKV